MIYKPTSCDPLLLTFDAKQTPFFLECQIDSANTKVDAYSIKLLNNDNEVVFPDPNTIGRAKEYTEIKDLDGYFKKYYADYDTGYTNLNQGYNGSYIKIPFIVAAANKAISTEFPTVRFNQLYYSKSDEDGSDIYQSIDDKEINIFNGQTYKWQITLYQLQKESNIYGGTLSKSGNNVVVNNISSELQKQLSITDTVIQLVNSGTDDTTTTPKQYGYKTLYDVYFDMRSSETITFANINLVKGEWLYSTATNWVKSSYKPESRSVIPVLTKYFDMSLTTGTVLGSTTNRIQTVKSDEIYSDYYIQLVKLPGLNINSETDWSMTNATTEPSLQNSRVLIKTYDQTYGYIYPVTGDNGFPVGSVTPNSAQGFQIYKRSNNPADLTVYQQASMVTRDHLDDRTDSTWKWEPSSADPGESYGVQTFTTLLNPNGVYEVPGIKPQTLIGAERIVLDGQHDKAQYAGTNWFSTKKNEYGGTSTVYHEYDVVYDTNERYYVSKKDDNTDPLDNTSSWTVGKTAVEIIYNNNIAYDKYSVISFNNVYYVAHNNITAGHSPADDGEYLGSPYNGLYYPSFTTDGIDAYWKKTDNSISVWTEGTVYSKYDVVCKENSVGETTTITYYISKIDNNEYPPTGADVNWHEQSSIPTYTSYETYDEFNLIEYSVDSNKYVCVRYNPASEGTNVAPGAVIGSYQVTVEWRRTPDANNWGSLSNKIIYITSGTEFLGYNIQIQEHLDSSTEYGTINETPLIFVKEKPINIYNNTERSDNPYINNTGLIFYNYAGANEDKQQYLGQDNRLYIRPFTGIKKGMRWLENTTTNWQYYFDIEEFNSTYWYIKYGQYNGRNAIFRWNTYKPDEDLRGSEQYPNHYKEWESDTTQYQIKTYFRDSDENTFYFNTTPEIHLHFYNNEDLEKTHDYIESATATDWSNTETYNINDIVFDGHQGDEQYYISKVDDNINIDPSTDVKAYVNNNVNNYHNKINNPADEVELKTKIWHNTEQNSIPIFNKDGNYTLYSIVGYSGKYYVNLTGAWSSITPNLDATNWKITTIQDWTDTDYYNTQFPRYAVVRYGTQYYVKINNGYTTVDPLNAPNVWTVVTKYDNAKTYQQYEVCFTFIDTNETYKRYWMSRQANNTSKPTTENPKQWKLLDVSTWQEATVYDSHSVVLFGDNWELYNYGIYRDQFNISATYYIGDIVWSDNDYYQCFISTAILQDTNEKPIRQGVNKYVGGHSYSEGDIVYYTSGGETYYYYCKKEMVEEGKRLVSIPPTNTKYWRYYQWQNYVVNVTSRMLVCTADYKQLEYIQWKSAQWFLYDTQNNLIDSSDIIYDNEIKHVFTGLDGQADYVVTLVVETYQGFRVTVNQEIKTLFTITEIDGTSLINTQFDCDKMAVVSTITTASGFIKPDPLNNADVATYSNDHMLLTGAMQYKQILSSLENLNPNTQLPIHTAASNLELKANTRINSNTFVGNLFKINTYIDSVGVANHSDPNNIASTFNVYVPNNFNIDTNSNDVLHHGLDRIITETEDKNTIYYHDDFDYPQEKIRMYDGITLQQSNKVSDSNWLNSTIVNPDNTKFKTVSDWQPLSLGDAVATNTNYLPISYATVGNNSTTYLNINNCFNYYDNSLHSDINAVLTTKQIQQTYLTRSDNFGINVSATNTNTSRFNCDSFTVTANGIQGSGAQLLVYGPTPQIFSDFKYEAKSNVLSAGGADTNLQYRQKNVYSKNNKQWNDADELNLSSNHKFWYDGDNITQLEDRGIVLGQIFVDDNTTPYNVEYLESSSNERSYGKNAILTQVEIRDSNNEYINNERALLTKVNISIDAPLDVDEENSMIQTFADDNAPVLYFTSAGNSVQS